MEKDIKIKLICYDKYKAFEEKFCDQESSDCDSNQNREVITKKDLTAIFKKRFSEPQNRDFLYKKGVYGLMMTEDQYANISAMNKRYKRSDFSELKTSIIASGLADFVGIESLNERVIVDSIFESPRVCLELFLQISENGCKGTSNRRFVSILNIAMEADRKNCSFILCKKEKRKFWNTVFPEIPLEICEQKKDYFQRFTMNFLVKNHIKNMLQNKIEKKETQEKKEVKRKNEEINIGVIEICNYLVDFIAFLHIKNKYNPLKPAKKMDLNDKLSKDEEEKLLKNGYLSSDEKEILRKCKNLLNYQKALQREYNNEGIEIVDNYLSLVVNYLKFCTEHTFSLLNLHLFEDVFGFCYTCEITMYILKKEFEAESMFDVRIEYSLYNLLGKIFSELDTEVRIDFSKYVIDLVYSKKDKMKAIRKATELMKQYACYNSQIEISNLKKNKKLNKVNGKWMENISYIDELYECIESNAGFMRWYYKVIAVLGDIRYITSYKDKKVQSCIIGEKDNDNVERIKLYVNKIKQNMFREEDNARAMYIWGELLSGITFHCWEHSGIIAYCEE